MTYLQDNEKNWIEFWEKFSLYHWDSDGKREDSFVIDTPPPTVSGDLHMGHIYSYTQIDYVARYLRMTGKNVFFPAGWDDNGLPTERLVEKLRGIRASDVEPGVFIEICREVIAEVEERFKSLFIGMGFSIDWRYCYQTVSEETQKISQLSFIDLYEKGHIKRKNAPTVWDTVDRTALAQAELEDKEREGVMNYIQFPIEQKADNILIATTRPELLPACVAVFVHPDDERYRTLLEEGAHIVTPIWNKTVPLIADKDVDPDKGTGAVMCCTFGDMQDVVWWQRHKLPLISCLRKDGKMFNTGLADELSVKEARALVIEKLQETALLTKQEKVVQRVKCAERSGAPIEIIVTEQWYISTLEHKEQILENGRKCQWYPGHMRNKFEAWVNGLSQDWCISRQRYFGVHFPVWYSLRPGEEGKVIVASTTNLPVNPKITLPDGYRADEVIADMDVMDTWATSCITPQISSLGISEKYFIDKERHQKLFPADLRPQSHEIIRTWAFGTIVKSLLHQASVPWHKIMISGWCLAKDKSKMSKSKGNSITPEDLLRQHGVDIVRYWASNAKLGCDIAYTEEPFAIGKRLINKLRNATKFCLTHLKEEYDLGNTAIQDQQNGRIFYGTDLWILTKLRQTILRVTASFAEFEYHDARVTCENFFWKDLCDNYIELIKGRLYQGESREAESAAITLYHCLRTILLLFAPILPYVTEDLFYALRNQQVEYRSIHSKGFWPDAANFPCIDERNGECIVNLLELVRKFKSQRGLSLNAQIHELIIAKKPPEVDIDDNMLSDLARASGSRDVNTVDNVNLRDQSFIEVSSVDGAYKISITEVT